MSKVISKILLCLDGSENSLISANQALKIAKQFNSEIVALHVIHVPLSITITPVVWEKNREENLKTVQGWIKDITNEAKEANITIHIEIQKTDDSITKKILEISDERNIDLIVIGSTGKSRLSRITMGSTAQSVTTNAKCSVLVVR
jgi:nucleotide-binding universal stress UspA family protein